MPSILGCFVVVSLLVMRLPGGKVTVYPLGWEPPENHLLVIVGLLLKCYICSLFFMSPRFTRSEADRQWKVTLFCSRMWNDILTVPLFTTGTCSLREYHFRTPYTAGFS